MIVPVPVPASALAGFASQIPHTLVRPHIIVEFACAAGGDRAGPGRQLIIGSTTMHQSHDFLAKHLPVPMLNPGLSVSTAISR